MAFNRHSNGLYLIENKNNYFIYKTKSMSKNKFIYGIAAVKFKEKTVGYIPRNE